MPMSGHRKPDTIFHNILKMRNSKALWGCSARNPLSLSQKLTCAQNLQFPKKQEFVMFFDDFLQALVMPFLESLTPVTLVRNWIS